MTVSDDGKNCHDCRQLRVERKAHRIMPSGAGVCEEHYRSRMGLPQRTSEATAFVKFLAPVKLLTPKSEPQGETPMAKKPDQETIDAMQKDAAAGLSTNQIAEKNHVGWSTARKYANAQGGANTLPNPKQNRMATRSRAAAAA